MRIIYFKSKLNIFMWIGALNDDEIVKKCKDNSWVVLSVRDL